MIEKFVYTFVKKMSLDNSWTIMNILIVVYCIQIVDGAELLIHTEDKGEVNAEITPDITKYYTKLSDYGITAPEYKSLIFDIKACHQAHVMLSTSEDLNSENFYEIILGGFDNTRLIIRRYNRGSDILLIDEGLFGILQCDEFTWFTISWYDFGTIVVQMKYTNVKSHDDDIFTIKGFGIMTAYGATGTWKFGVADCINNTYGNHCEKPCGHCHGGEQCYRYSGSCRNGCEENWQGEMCDAMVHPKCPCPCVKKKTQGTWTNLTGEKLLASLKPKMALIEKKLAVNKTSLSSSKRKLISAPDNRMTSKSIGIVGAVFLTVVVGLLIIIDISALIK